jgi:N-acetylglucosamine-6-phosphate deacetylase
MRRIKIFNARIITPYRVIANGCVIIENGRIACVSEADIPCGDCFLIDAHQYYVSPGFIDIHTHGAGGSDFMDGTAEAFFHAAEVHARYGATSIVPTTSACSVEELKNTLEAFKSAKQSNTHGAKLLGLHLEGPYFSMKQSGALDPRYIHNPRPEEYMKILGWSDDIIRWSAAPELEGALEFGRIVSERGILVSIAHSDAIFEQVREAYEIGGYRHITHLYSAMSGVKRIDGLRYAGVIESAYLIDGLTVEIIADGMHLPESLLKLIYKIKGAGKIALVTDSMRAAAMPDGPSIFGSLRDGQNVIVEDGVAKLPDKSAFAGSVATTDRLVRTMVNIAGVELTEAVRMVTSTPAAIIGQKSKGSLDQGKDADIVIFDENINVKMTMVEGNLIFASDGSKL